MEHISQIIAAAKSENVVDMRAAFDSAMNSKVAEILDNVRQEQGNAIFDRAEVEESVELDETIAAAKKLHAVDPVTKPSSLIDTKTKKD